MVGSGFDLAVFVSGKVFILRGGGNLCPDRGGLLIPAKADVTFTTRWVQHTRAVPVCHEVAHVLTLGPAVVVDHGGRVVGTSVRAAGEHAAMTQYVRKL